MSCTQQRQANLSPDFHPPFHGPLALRGAARRAVFAFLVLALGGCSSGLKALVESVQQVTQGHAGVDQFKIAPKFSYLRVSTASVTAIMALERVEPHPNGPVLVWHSAFGEVLRTQNGRVVGATGLLTEWRGVLLPQLPSWLEVAAAREPVHWVRVRDVMPGYRFGIRDELVVRAVPPLQKSNLRELDPNTLTWFEERLDRRSAFGPIFLDGTLNDAGLPPARYAVQMGGDRETVLYGEQCLAPEVCLTWQHWSSEMQEANRLKITRPKQ